MDWKECPVRTVIGPRTAFQIFFSNFTRWISGTMLMVVPPAFRMSLIEFNMSSSSGVLTKIFGVGR